MVAFCDCGMKVRLTRKFAAMIDGVDLSNHDVGDVIDLPQRKADLLIAEGWAVEERRWRSNGRGDVLAFRRVDDPAHLGRDGDEGILQAS